MKTIIQKLVFALFICLFSLSMKAQMNITWADTLNQLLDQCRTNESMKGVAAGVVFSDGSTWSSASGYHGLNNLSKDYLYDIGSNTKSMVATIILQMEEEGKLSIDDTLYQFLQPIPNVSYGITLKQLLSHRSGVFSYTEHANFSGEINTYDKKFWHPDSILVHFMSPQKFSPGSSFEYSNTNYLLLGKVVEVIDNKALNVVLRDRIFDPIGIDSIYLDQYDPYSLVKTGAWLSSSNYFDEDFISFMSSAWAAGGVVSTPKDFAKYTKQLFSGQLFGAASLQKMQQGTSIGGGGTYGLGAIKWNYKGKTYLGHGGTTLQNSEMEYSVSSDFSLIIMNIDYGFYNETARTKLKFIDLLEYIEDQQASIGFVESIQSKFEFETFPNPSSDIMNIEFKEQNENEVFTLEIRDLTGKIIMKQQLDKSSYILKKADVGTGVFVLSLFADGKWVENKKLVFN